MEGGGKTKALVEIRFLIPVPNWWVVVLRAVVRGLLYCQVKPNL